ncbi:MAG: hypothetical protein AB2L14_13750 [Candidatus Xenobiia bacterium LiM19]
MSERIRDFLGDPVHVVLRGYDGVDEEHFGVVGCNGTRYYLRTDRLLMDLNINDIVDFFPYKAKKG